MKHNYLLISVFLISLISCNNDPDQVIDKEAEVDQELEQTLKLVAENGEVSYFKLPTSTDLDNIPQDPKNPLTEEKVALGKLLYHETGLALNAITDGGKRTYSCASCHHAQAGFQAGIRQGIGDGGIGFGIAGEGRSQNNNVNAEQIDVQPVRSPSTLNSAYQVAQLWNGQFGAVGPNEDTEAQWTEGTPKFANHLGFEGVETQAIAGFDVHRLGVDTSLIMDTDYKAMFDEAFPEVDKNKRYGKEQIGLAMAAYERTLLANEAPWQRYLNGEQSALTQEQKLGAILFFGKANCVSCHNGPALNSMEFYALGMGDLTGDNVFRFTVDDPAHKGRASFTGNSEDDYKFKVPQLYNLKDSPFYGHGGTFNTVKEVVTYKNEAVIENTNVPNTQLALEFVPLELNEEEIDQLTDFIENGLYDPSLLRYLPDHLPSNLNFPNNDSQSQVDLSF
ncbi:cytochrome-c peroxidase [Chondrinema litorale]|uniref:cytochrome-c peroxidase n=1 Tax=Chondrinema litorale TaxID=2994555 RepID=UPI0025429305|nr:cytochrome c peroxidase [Chondrinema litorale]UZR96511.1 cytochrome-c peroxidase [Chondrinema litorale]